MALRNLVKRELVSCTRDTTVKRAAELMEVKDVGAIVVTENQKPIGIVTDRDITVRCIAKDMNAADTPVAHIMTKTVRCAGLDEGIFNVAQMMKKFEIRRVPIVDELGCAVGLLSFGDVFELVAKEISFLIGPTSPENSKIEDKAA